MTDDHPAIIGNAPIFIYSGFRASSTWLWSKFRPHENLLCYYEPFNEQLARLTLENIGQARPDGWRSHHPSGAPYLLEYAGMLEDEVGVPGFPQSRNLGERYIGTAGPEGPLDTDVSAYVQGLIGHAQHLRRVPLLACTRLLGRAQGMRTAFGGYHILLLRNLYHQWNSYAGQARFGNWYFLQTLFETLELADRDPVIAQLAKVFPEGTCNSFDIWVAPENFDRVFCYFIGFHLYFLTLARRSADVVVDVNMLAKHNLGYRHKIVAKVASDVGIRLDLNDATEKVDFPLYPIADRSGCATIIDEMAATIKLSCNARANEKAFINDLIAALWLEQGAFMRQASGAIEYVAQLEGTLRAAERDRLDEVNSLRILLNEKQSELDAERARIASRDDISPIG
ncbi:chromosome segregation ATPase-like protein [Novosphingobium sp. Rr 2-17]|uniref:hypothetical protein n=1 Tax=Novosphingobium sp. Rr 2-17 TaxID=555793 RepID=UPI0002697BD8|nr:hypothetical protein [Novosphingobium sp. Rr 2-17]EIZ77178.1 chromosome segregation ATPase-like protein [Novosphingobium sp. Rr 2-17]